MCLRVSWHQQFNDPDGKKKEEKRKKRFVSFQSDQHIFKPQSCIYCIQIFRKGGGEYLEKISIENILKVLKRRLP